MCDASDEATGPRGSETRDQDALILGANSPIGAGISAALEQDGWQVLRHRRAPSDPSEAGPDGWIYGDLTKTEDIDRLVATIEAQPPRLLVFVASMFWPGCAATLGAEDARRAFTVNALATLLIGDAQLRGAARGRAQVSQLHLLDLAGEEPFLSAAGYSLSRGASDNALRQLSRRAPAQASVIGLELGIVAIPGRARPGEELIAARDTLARRPATLQEVLALVKRIVERPAAFHGARLRIDGGLALRPAQRG